MGRHGRGFLVPSHVLVAPLQGLQECTRGVLLLNGHSVHFSNIGVLETGSNLANKCLKPANEYSTVKFVTHSSCAGLIVFHISLFSSCCCTDYPTQSFPFVFMCHSTVDFQAFRTRERFKAFLQALLEQILGPLPKSKFHEPFHKIDVVSRSVIRDF